MSEEYRILVSAEMDSSSIIKIKKKLIKVQEEINSTRFQGEDDALKAHKADLQIQLRKLQLEKEIARITKNKDIEAKKASIEASRAKALGFKEEKAIATVQKEKLSAQLKQLQVEKEVLRIASMKSKIASQEYSAKTNSPYAKTSQAIEKAQKDAKILAMSLGKIGTTEQRAQIGRYNFELHKMKITSDMTEDEIRQMGAAATKTYKNMSYLRREMAATHKETKSLGTVMGNAITKFSMWMGVTAIFYGITGAMKSLITRSGELDKAVTSLRVVTGKTKEEAWETIGVYSDLADQMGTTTTAVAEGTLEWLRQGKTVQEAMSLTTESIKMARLGFMDSGQATEYLTSSINGFNMEAKDATMIVDKLVAVDNNAATSTAELATALQRTASSADMAGVSFDEVVSYIGTVSEVTRKSAGGIGETFKTLFARIQNVKLNKLVEEETTGIVTTINDVEKALGTIGVSLRTSRGTFKDTSDLFGEISQKWEGLSQVEKSAIATTVAGVRQRENFLVLMNNYNRALELQQVQADSAGSSAKAYNAVLDSQDTAINRLTNSWDKFVSKVGEGGGVQAALKVVTNALNFVSDEIDKRKAKDTANREAEIAYITNMFDKTGGGGKKFESSKFDIYTQKIDQYTASARIAAIETRRLAEEAELNELAMHNQYLAVKDFSSEVSELSSEMGYLQDIESKTSKNKQLDIESTLELIAKYPKLTQSILDYNNQKITGMDLTNQLFEVEKTAQINKLELKKQEIITNDRVLAQLQDMIRMGAISGIVANQVMRGINPDIKAIDSSINLVKGLTSAKSYSGASASDSSADKEKKEEPIKYLDKYYWKLEQIAALEYDISVLTGDAKLKKQKELQSVYHALNVARRLELADLTKQYYALSEKDQYMTKGVDLLEKMSNLQKDIRGTSSDWLSIQKDITSEIENQAELDAEKLDALTESITAELEHQLELIEDKYNGEKGLITLLENRITEQEKLNEAEEVALARQEKELAISKAQIALDKAKLALANAQNEKNTKVLVNGVWQWQANTGAVRSAQEEVTSAQGTLDDAKKELNLYNIEQAKKEYIDGLKQQIGTLKILNDKEVKDINTKTKMIESLEDSSFSTRLLNLNRFINEWNLASLKLAPTYVSPIESGATGVTQPSAKEKIASMFSNSTITKSANNSVVNYNISDVKVSSGASSIKPLTKDLLDASARKK